MGSSRWSAADWAAYTAQTSTQTRGQIFSRSTIHPDLDPLNIRVRESVDSDANPASTPIILAVDETGSMGILAEIIIRSGLGTIMEEIYDRKPVSDPHIMCMGIGDAFSDQAPLQVTQFEADIVLANQLSSIFLEGNGGGNGGESYLLAWYFAAFKTRCDAQTKRHRKGYIFTIGDEAPHPLLTKEQIGHFIGDKAEADMTSAGLLATVSQNWEVFHLIVQPAYPEAITRWRELLGERSIEVADYNKLAEVIVSTIQVIEGQDAAKVAASWNSDTALVVANAIGSLTKSQAADGGVVRM
ncbi:MAG TPA: hypothetical protein VHI13_12085 [Candidatus Kapabacteria bacterium]|nr:hypothetical protein [Candidatus Kapabacteria bacterium]